MLLNIQILNSKLLPAGRQAKQNQISKFQLIKHFFEFIILTIVYYLGFSIWKLGF